MPTYPKLQLYVDGEGKSADGQPVINPADESILGTVLPPPTGPELDRRMQRLLAPSTCSRRKIWEFDTKLHCSILGTCLSTAELRQVLI